MPVLRPGRNLAGYNHGVTLRAPSVALADLPNPNAVRKLVDEVQRHALDHLDFYLEQLAEAVSARGGRVVFAADAKAARASLESVLAKTPSVLLQNALLGEQIRVRQCLTRLRLHPAEGNHGRPVIFPALAIAESGQVCLIGNGPPPTETEAVIAVVGTHQIAPRLADVGVLLKWVGRLSSGRPVPPDVRLISAQHLIVVDSPSIGVPEGRINQLMNRFRRNAEPSPAATEWANAIVAALKAPERWQRWGARA